MSNNLLITTLSDFSYYKTSEILFELSNDAADPFRFLDTTYYYEEQYAMLFLISVSERAEIQVFRFYEQRVDLTKCYNFSFVTFDIEFHEIIISLVPSLECTLHIADRNVVDYVDFTNGFF